MILELTEILASLFAKYGLIDEVLRLSWAIDRLVFKEQVEEMSKENN